MDVTAGPSRAEQMKARWSGLGGKLGMSFAALGFVLIVVAWNGAAGVDYTQGQIPYLISGGIAGLGLIVLGGALILTESGRHDRAELQRQLEELNATVSRLAPSLAVAGSNGNGAAAATGPFVVAGRQSFHDPSCRLVQGRDDAAQLSRQAAEAEGLAACRVCNP